MVTRVPRASARVARKRQLQAATRTHDNPGSGSDSSSGDENENEDVQHETSSSENDIFEENDAADESRPRKRRRGVENGAENVGNNGNNDISAETHLFRALSLREVAVADLALEWIDSYEEDESAHTSTAITDLFNLVLSACGCTHMAQPHDMLNDDSAAATVGEIAVVFSSQALHEYPFVAVHKNTRHFRQNVTEFFKSIVSTAHEKGVLYQPAATEQTSSLGTPLMNSVVAWLVALSACNVRPLRYVSTCLLLAMQTQFCELASTTTIALQKQQRQLNSARNNRRVQAARVAVISESIEIFTLQKNTVLEYIGEVFQHVFVNRYRDIDPRIRCECLRALVQWMVLYEEMFLRADYLRYIGWLLLDPAENVRLESVKLLLRLFKFIHGKREAMSIGFRQFTERFKDQFISMVWKEKKAQGIRTHLLEILTEIYGLGFLEEKDVFELCLFGFYLADHESSAHADTKAKMEVAKFAGAVVLEQARMEIEPFNLFLELHESTHFDADDNALSVLQCLKYKKLAELFEASYAHYTTIRQELGNVHKPMFVLVDLLFRVVYSLLSFLGQWEGLIKYTLDDFSAITFINKEDPSASVDAEIVHDLVHRIEISSLGQKRVFLAFIAAAIIHILTKEPPKRTTTLNVHDDLNAVLPVLIRYILPLEAYLSSGINLYAIFMSIWNSILLTVPTSITRLYSTVSDISDYNAVHDKVLHYFFDVVSPEDMLQESFDTYFSLILKNFEGSSLGDVTSKTDRLLNANIKIQIEDLLHSLATEGVDTLFLTEPFEESRDAEENRVLLEDHKIAVNKLLRVAPILQKFSQIARVINISRYVAEPTFGTSSVLLEALQSQLVSGFDFIALTRLWPSSYTTVMAQFSESWICVLDFILLALSWKLEDLTYASGDNSSQLIDISLFLEDFSALLISTGDHCVAVGTSAKELNEITSESNTTMRSLVRNLVSLEHKFAAYYIDMLTSIRTFYDKFKDGDNFKNFALFFENEAGVGALAKGQLPNVIQESLMRVFFIHESRLAQLKSISLDRQNNEDVNFDDFVFEGDCPVTGSGVESDENQLGQTNVQKDQLVWAAERVLCVYALKLYSLIHTEAFSRDAVARIQLNSKRLGGMFKKIVGVGQAHADADVDVAEPVEARAGMDEE